MPGPRIDLTLGVIELGIVISIFLYGVATVQAYIYVRTRKNKNDPFLLKLLVS